MTTAHLPAASAGIGRSRQAKPTVLADLVAWTRVRDAALVVAGTAVLVIAARVIIPLPITPVPLSLATLAVLVVGAVLGPWRGAAAAGLYLLMGVAGVPVFSDGRVGWAFASFGYILGFVAAAGLVGWLASRGWDRSVWRMAGAAALGSLTVYALGLLWLIPWLGVGLGEGLAMGMVPFLVGDALKIAVAAGLIPALWKLTSRS